MFIRILNNKKVLLEGKNKKLFQCSINKLHKVPYKAVAGYKARERVKQQMNEQKQKEKESLVDKNVQKKVKQLGHSVYATMENDKYVVRGYKQTVSFNTLEELDSWVDVELIKVETTKNRILANGYKHLYVTCKDGHKEYYTIINISFVKYEISCKHFKGNIEDIIYEKLLDREDVKEFRLKIHRN